jgi:hypothetical protein
VAKLASSTAPSASLADEEISDAACTSGEKPRPVAQANAANKPAGPLRPRSLDKREKECGPKRFCAFGFIMTWGLAERKAPACRGERKIWNKFRVRFAQNQKGFIRGLA